MANILVLLLGFIIAVGLTVWVVRWVRGPLSRFLGHIIDDPAVVELGTSFVLILLALRGLSAAVEYITQPELARLLGGITGLLSGLANDVQWVGQIAALLFIGYAIRQWRGERPGERTLADRE